MPTAHKSLSTFLCQAYYFGTMLLVASLLWSGVTGDDDARRRGLLCGGGLLGAFTVGRAWSYVADGPPNSLVAELTWLCELLGSCWLLGLRLLEKRRMSAVRSPASAAATGKAARPKQGRSSPVRRATSRKAR